MDRVRQRSDSVTLPVSSGPYHKWTSEDMDWVKYAAGSLPESTTLSVFMNSMKIGDDCRGAVVTILSGLVPVGEPESAPAKGGRK